MKLVLTCVTFFNTLVFSFIHFNFMSILGGKVIKLWEAYQLHIKNKITANQNYLIYMFTRMRLCKMFAKLIRNLSNEIGQVPSY